MLSRIVLLNAAVICATLRVGPILQAGQSALVAGQSALVAGALSTALLVAPPALAAPAPLNDAIVEATEASYPIIQALDGAFPGFTRQLGKLVLDIKPEKLAAPAEKLVDVFNSVPPGKIATFNSVVKEAFADLKTDSCTLVPLPPAQVADQFKAVAKSTVDPAKIKAFGDAWGGTIAALSKTDSAICLPPVATLDKLALAQAEVGRSFDYDTVQQFFDVAVPVLKSEIRLTDDTMALLVSSKNQATDATTQDKLAFQRASKKLEESSKYEKEKMARARLLERRAEAAAAKKAAAM